MDAYGVDCDDLRQQFKVEAMIVLVEKDSGSIYAALRDVQRDAANDETRTTGHETAAERIMPGLNTRFGTSQLAAAML